MSSHYFIRIRYIATNKLPLLDTSRYFAIKAQPLLTLVEAHSNVTEVFSALDLPAVGLVVASRHGALCVLVHGVRSAWRRGKGGVGCKLGGLSRSIIFWKKLNGVMD